MSRSYKDFLSDKLKKDHGCGIDHGSLNENLFPFQKDIVSWSLKKGMSSIFADCGLGKTIMELAWAEQIPGRVLIVAPLAVGIQTQHEGDKFGVKATYCRDDDDRHQIAITNYEMLHNFDLNEFHGIVLDESSILKSFTGKVRNQIINGVQHIPYRLAATATPSPNDLMEIGNHSEFVSNYSMAEMLATYFVHDGGETQKWRLKGHAKNDFWQWMCSWACYIRKPSDIGHTDSAFVLPQLKTHHVTVEDVDNDTDLLFAMPASTLSERQQARKRTIQDRVNATAQLCNGDANQWLVWCNLNAENDALAKAIPDAVTVKGSDSIDKKTKALMGFTDGSVRVLVTKPSIAGFGMNWQHCNNMVFTGLSDSYEQFYQAVRRSWRFGQKKQVNVYVVTADTEGAVVSNIKRKEASADMMYEGMKGYLLK